MSYPKRFRAALLGGLIIAAGWSTVVPDTADARGVRASGATSMRGGGGGGARASGGGGAHRGGGGMQASRGGYGGYQGILLDWDHGVLHGATEPRKDGAAVGY